MHFPQVVIAIADNTLEFMHSLDNKGFFLMI